MLLIAPNAHDSEPATRNSLRGFTLIEMLISMAVTLVMMAAVVTLFANIGEGVRNRNAGIEMGSQIRLARARLFKDLADATSPARPKLPSDDHDDGYLEIIEGQWSDKHPSLLVDGSPVTADNPELNYETSIIPSSNIGPEDGTDGGGLGDYDDILALTVRSDSEPFKGRKPVWDVVDGRWEYVMIESPLAEVIWFSVENPADGSTGEPGMRTVYRRVLLIAPEVSELPPYVKTSPGGAADNRIEQDEVCFQLSDISFRREGNLRIPNALSDLAKRENRFAHQLNGVSAYPYYLDATALRADPLLTPQFPVPPVVPGELRVLHPFGLPFEWDPAGDVPGVGTNVLAPGTSSIGSNRIGEDVMLNDVLAFDLRVYDPDAPLVLGTDGGPLEPSDASWYNPGNVNEIVGVGAFVDLGWFHNYYSTAQSLNVPYSPFSRQWRVGSKPNNVNAGYPCVYDTWPYSYENDGINQDNDVDINGNPLIDEGIDGLDNDNANGVDDSGERETAPPYDVALRAMQVKVRIYDRKTRQIREATVTRNFVPQ